MNKWFYTKLALTNIRKNSQNYIPYILTCIMTVMMFYIMKSLSQNPGISDMIGADTLSGLLDMGSSIVGFFSLIFLFYSSSFLMKRRKKEFGVFNILGLEKKHLARVAAIEAFFVAVISIVSGIIFGIALDKVMFLLIAKMIGAQVPLGFYISGEIICYTVIFFCIIFILILLRTINMIRVSNPIELLRGGNVGEKEPKTKWVMAVLGVAALGAGYYIALTVDNPIASLYLFFVAVLLVIIATYFLFTAGSIALLKLLRKNKNYYYKTKHFISISGMIYRMKQNAVGLANICILSTAVLVMVSTTTSLMVGGEDIMNTRFPNEFSVYSDESSEEKNKEIVSCIKNICEKAEFPVENEIGYYFLKVSAVRAGDAYNTVSDYSELAGLMDKINILVFTTVDDYNTIMGENVTLGENQVLIYSNREAYEGDTIKLFDRQYEIVGVLDKFYENGAASSNIVSTHYIVVPDVEELKILEKHCRESETVGLVSSHLRYYYGIDSSADRETQITVYSSMKEALSRIEYDGYAEVRETSRKSMLGVYGGLFFLGIFLGVLFMMATVLIIYYKQISEGYEDRERFQIMQKVGMSRNEVKSAIHSQVITVFFLPLITAGLHLAAAFSILTKLLAMLNMSNTSLYAKCVVICFVVFAAVYVVIYGMTAKTYYKIVSAAAADHKRKM